MTDETPIQRLRLFIAIPIPENVKDEIERIQAELRSAVRTDGIRWTQRHQFHLTLKFLGAVPENRVEALKHAVWEASRGFPALLLQAGGVGFFPSARAPRVVWVGVNDNDNVLPKLHPLIEAAAAEFSDEKPEKHFSGHVTLARIKRIGRTETSELTKLALSMANRILGNWSADQLEIIRSELLPSGSRYTTLANIPLPAEGGVGE